MSKRLTPVLLVLGALFVVSTMAAAAPSLDIGKPPVTPNISWTGPPGDPHATWGQWFLDKRTGYEQCRSHEFYDNLLGSGGGIASTNAIKGRVNGVGYAGGPGTNILSFSIIATITNDMDTQSGIWNSGSNSHSENLGVTYSDQLWMYNVKLTASFAVDANILPALWQGPYRPSNPYIIAQNYDVLAWYCWTPNNPQLKQPYGAYYIPTYDFQTIPFGQSVSRTLSFTVSGAGLPNTDSRYTAIVSSYLDGYDIFLNRTKSLKCSDWIDALLLDNGAAYPSSPPYKASDVSVFYEHDMKPRDWGDAPDGPYPTWAISGGANHIIRTDFNLGPPNDIDGEANGQPTVNADGDDLNGSDENGVVWNPPYVPGQVGATVTVIAQVPVGITGLLDAWIDFNNDGVWDDAPGSAEKIAAAVVVFTGPNVIAFNVPNNAVVGQTFARFRLSSVGNLPPTGMAKDGEVEDHTVMIGQSQLGVDWGDAPDPTYPTLSASNGASHQIVQGLCLGGRIDGEADGLQDPNALGDDNNNVDDEDGVTFNTALFANVPNVINVTATVPGPSWAYLSGWIDLNGDGDWADAGEQILTDAFITNGTNWQYSFTPWAVTATGSTFARFRLSTVQGLSYNGAAPDGEVEDYKIDIAPVKWIQRPDLSWYGVDVHAEDAPLADDFQCTMSGPITDIHIWTSFLNDLLPQQLNSLGFSLYIYSDVPAGLENPYSHPGDVLWSKEFAPFTYKAGLCAGVLDGEWWYDPTYEFWTFPGDFQVYQYDFYIDPAEAYRQREGTVYWLAVQCWSAMQSATLGWKSSNYHWNDDACWLDTTGPIPTWRELRYGDNHPMAPESMDLAFAITGVRGEEGVDWGDAPDPTYPTWSAAGGPRHQIVPGFFLGNLIDGEADGQPDAGATGDDLAGQPDEDGVVWLGPLWPGQFAQVQVTASQPGVLDSWIDFDGDGEWDDYYDQIAVSVPLAAGPNLIPINVPRTWRPTAIPTFSRFRFSSQGGLSYAGPAQDGEVEDHAVLIQPDSGTLYFSKLKDIKDHFWWPSDPDLDNEMISLVVFADPVEAISWDSITLQPNGTGDDAADISAVNVWLDNNYDGTVDPADTLIGTGAYPADDSLVTINLAPAPIMPAGSSLSVVISYTMSGLGNVLDTYYFDVLGASGTGQTSGRPVGVSIVPSPLTSATKYRGPDPISIGQAKKLAPGTPFLLAGKIVTADFTSNLKLLYIEEEGSWRYSGIGVNAGAIVIPPFFVGDHCQVYGTCSLLAGTELIVQPQVVLFSAGDPMSPVGMNNKATGGGLFGFQPGVLDDALTGTPSYGLNNVGLLVKTWGEVTFRRDIPVPDGTGATVFVDAFWIDDGSNLKDGFSATHGKIKWAQPPVHAEGYPVNHFWGWNEQSVWGSGQIVADDFFCKTTDPITDFHWWGSFIGWTSPTPEWPQPPDAFHIAIWSDVPAGIEPYSHPGRVLWQTICSDYHRWLVGWDIDPRDPAAPMDACFLFTAELDPMEAWQQETPQGIYWVSIAAIYNQPPQQWRWGWKTRPRDLDSRAPDDAVRISNPTSWPPPPPWPQYISGGPIWWPDPEKSWDMAFELTTSGYSSGVAVLRPPDALYLPFGYVDVTGIMRAIPNFNGQTVRLLVPRTWYEITRHK